MTGSVAVIGAGPGGLAAARWLLSQGFEPTIFEQAPLLGGQWTGLSDLSGVWPTMHTNTSRVMTAFSDLEHETDLVYPSGHDILDYLCRYAETFALVSRIRFGTRVERLCRCDAGWLVDYTGTSERFEKVVVATGRFQSAAIPTVPGLETFAGSAGVISTYQYRGAAPYRGKRVLVAGGAISALEIAADIAQLGAARVVVSQRRQRYVLPKFAAGVPSDHRIFTRYGTLANERLPAAEVDRQLKEIVVEAGGSPEQYGAPAPDPSLFAAGVTLSQHYLPLVAEGLITVRPWMESIANAAVSFTDGTAEEFDGIVFGTGFDLHLPFLSEDIRAIIDLDAVHMDADRYTFHPDLPGLAFVGMWDQAGGYFVPLELQARWIAYTWGGAVPATSEAGQRSSIDAYRSRRGMPQKTRMNLVALAFARAAGGAPLGELAAPAPRPTVRPPCADLLPAGGVRTPFPTPRPGSLAMPLRSARSRQTSWLSVNRGTGRWSKAPRRLSHVPGTAPAKRRRSELSHRFTRQTPCPAIASDADRIPLRS